MASRGRGLGVQLGIQDSMEVEGRGPDLRLAQHHMHLAPMVRLVVEKVENGHGCSFHVCPGDLCREASMARVRGPRSTIKVRRRFTWRMSVSPDSSLREQRGVFSRGPPQIAHNGPPTVACAPLVLTKTTETDRSYRCRESAPALSDTTLIAVPSRAAALTSTIWTICFSLRL